METTIPVRVPTELRDRLERRATQAERSLSGEIRLILREALEPKTAEPRP